MLFQTLDDKSECVGIYAGGKLIFNDGKLPAEISKTWEYAPYLRDRTIEYASVYLQGSPLEEVLPEYLQDDWADAANKLKSFRRSMRIASVSEQENCFYDLVPPRFLIEMCEVRNRITEYVFKNVPRPVRYEYEKKVMMLLSEIAQHQISLDARVIASYSNDPKLKHHAKRIQEAVPYVGYKQFGTVTGRLSGKRGHFPILTLPREFRQAVIPSNDYYLELDFNGAEVRTLLGMLNKEQPTGDVHSYHLENVFRDMESRDEAKVAFFAWLYGSKRNIKKSVQSQLESFYDKNTLLTTYWRNQTITTPFKKVIKDVDRHHALNYLVQSTCAELTLKQALKIDYLLRTQGSGSHIAFLIHDAIVLDFKEEDHHLLPAIEYLMSSTNFGKFGINIKTGKTLGSMREVRNG